MFVLNAKRYFTTSVILKLGGRVQENQCGNETLCPQWNLQKGGMQKWSKAQQEMGLLGCIVHSPNSSVDRAGHLSPRSPTFKVNLRNEVGVGVQVHQANKI